MNAWRWARVLGAGLAGGMLCWALLVQVEPAAAARPEEMPTASPRVDTRMPDPLVTRLQTLLADAGYFRGEANGLVDEATREAIRNYQRDSNLKVDGAPSEDLATRLETGEKVALLLRRLDRARTEHVDAARRALESRPETRALLEGPRRQEIADPTRDPGPCFRAPTPACLLAEAVESAKAIHKPEMRDWALGEILAAQAKAGLVDEAMATARRISDPRLIMVALRAIAEAQAQAGRPAEAMAAAEIIPDALQHGEALLAIARILARGGQAEPAREAAGQLADALSLEVDPLKRLALRAQAAVVMARTGATERADSLLAKAEQEARALSVEKEREAGLRQVAGALAEMDRPEQALAVLADVRGESDRTPVLVSTASAQAKAGDSDAALETASSIEAERYRAVVLGDVAVAQNHAGDAVAAQATIAAAREAARAIRFPYARSYALSRIALAVRDMASRPGGPGFAEARAAAQDVEDPQLRASVLWAIAADQARAGDEEGARATEADARQATLAIVSSLSRVWLYCDVAMARVGKGETDAGQALIEEGLAIAEATRNVWGRARALAKLADTLADLDRARDR